MPENNPLFQEGDKWYYWCEGRASTNGPFDTETEAYAHLAAYYTWLTDPNSAPALNTLTRQPGVILGPDLQKASDEALRRYMSGLLYLGRLADAD